MAYPTVSALAQRLYDSLPEHYRTADAAQAEGDNGYPLLRYLSLVADRAGELETLLDRIQMVPADEGGQGGSEATSDLVDPDGADAAWLPWLAQLVGVQLAPSLTELQRRDEVRYASSGWRAATTAAVEDAARSELTGDKYAAAYDHSTTLAGKGAAGEWDVLIVTRTSETPDVAAVLAAIAAKGAKPVGVDLHHEAYEATWDTVELKLPTWNDWEAAGSWTAVEETLP